LTANSKCHLCKEKEGCHLSSIENSVFRTNPSFADLLEGTYRFPARVLVRAMVLPGMEIFGR
jgi:hypothetical protein